MGQATKQSAETNRLSDSQPPCEVWGHWLDTAFQLSLMVMMAGLVWLVFGSEPQTAFENRLQLIVLGLGFSLSTGFWIAGSTCAPRIKTIGIFACSLAAIAVGLNSAREFDAASHILDRALVKQGRIGHPAIGLSYAYPPGYRVNLQPFITQSSTPEANRLESPRLRLGDQATLSRMERTQVQETGRLPSSIMLQVVSNSLPHSNALIRAIRQFETHCATLPDIQITQHTQRCRIAGMNMIEFSFFDKSQHLTGRHVYLQAGAFTLRFILVAANEADRAQFDEFLNSIRLESLRP